MAEWRPHGPWEWIGIILGIWGIPGIIDDGGVWTAWLKPMSLYTEAAPFAVLLGVLLFAWGRLRRSREYPKPTDDTATEVSETMPGPHAAQPGGTVTLEHSNNDGKYRFGEGKHKFMIHWSPHNHDTVRLKKVGERGHMALVTDDEIKDPSSYEKADSLVIGEGQKAVFQNGHGNWATIEIINVEHKKSELEFCYAIMPPTSDR